MRILQIENNNLRSSVIISDNSKTHATVQNNNNNKEDLTWWNIPTSCNADLTRRRQDDILPPFERPCLLTYPIKKPTRWEDGAGSRRIVRDSFLQLNASLSERRDEPQRNSKATACLSPVCPRRQDYIDAVDLEVPDSSKDLRIINSSQGKWRAAQQSTLSPVCPKRQASIDEEWDDLDVNVEEDQEASSHESLKAPACGRLGRILESSISLPLIYRK
jgi:hypothetical protein